jgi:hypothetical protein
MHFLETSYRVNALDLLAYVEDTDVDEAEHELWVSRWVRSLQTVREVCPLCEPASESGAADKESDFLSAMESFDAR